MKNFTLFPFLFFLTLLQSNPETLIINIYITVDSQYYVEEKAVAFAELKPLIVKILMDAKRDTHKAVIYRLFADENLPLGKIIDTEQILLGITNKNVKRERYLLSQVLYPLKEQQRETFLSQD